MSHDTDPRPLSAQRNAGANAAFWQRVVSTGMVVSDLSNLLRSRDTDYRGHAAIAAVAVIIGVFFAGSTLLTPLYVIYQERFGFSHVTLTLIYAVYVAGNLAALLLFGRVSDKLGRRWGALAAVLIAISSTFAFLFAQSTSALYVGRFLSGLALGVGSGSATAWLAELLAHEDRARSATIATTSNFVGLGIGSLLSGLLAQYLPWPLHVGFVVYLAALLAIGLGAWRVRETVPHRVQSIRQLPLRPQLSLPANVRSQFMAPATAGFGAMALVGFYAAIAPTLLAERLHVTNHAVAGAIFFELATAVAGTILLTRHLPSRRAMLWGAGLMIPSVLLLVAAEILGSTAVLLLATAVCGAAAGLGYRGSMQVVNEIAPQDRRAAMMSSYFVCVFCGNALPVIGIGVVSTLTSSLTATLVFAATVSLFALVALRLER
jgi:MFS family permease